jgi:hypothetical protein
MPETTDAEITTLPVGHPTTHIPPEIIELLTSTYTAGKAMEIPGEPDSEDAQHALRLMKIYAKRHRKGLNSQFVRVNGEYKLRFQMRDLRSYTFKTPTEKKTK